jgi:hypothetical protein
VGESAGQQCLTALQATTAALEAAMAVDPISTLALFNVSGMDDGDFWYLMADSGAEVWVVY